MEGPPSPTLHTINKPSSHKSASPAPPERAIAQTPSPPKPVSQKTLPSPKPASLQSTSLAISKRVSIKSEPPAKRTARKSVPRKSASPIKRISHESVSRKSTNGRSVSRKRGDLWTRAMERSLVDHYDEIFENPGRPEHDTTCWIMVQNELANEFAGFTKTSGACNVRYSTIKKNGIAYKIRGGNYPDEEDQDDDGDEEEVEQLNATMSHPFGKAVPSKRHRPLGNGASLTPEVGNGRGKGFRFFAIDKTRFENEIFENGIPGGARMKELSKEWKKPVEKLQDYLDRRFDPNNGSVNVKDEDEGEDDNLNTLAPVEKGRKRRHSEVVLTAAQRRAAREKMFGVGAPSSDEESEDLQPAKKQKTKDAEVPERHAAEGGRHQRRPTKGSIHGPAPDMSSAVPDMEVDWRMKRTPLARPYYYLLPGEREYAKNVQNERNNEFAKFYREKITEVEPELRRAEQEMIENDRDIKNDEDAIQLIKNDLLCKKEKYEKSREKAVRYAEDLQRYVVSVHRHTEEIRQEDERHARRK